MENVSRVLEKIKALSTVAEYGLKIPTNYIFPNHVDCANCTKIKIGEIASYIVESAPESSWEKLAVQLYQWEEFDAVLKVIRYIDTAPGKYA